MTLARPGFPFALLFVALGCNATFAPPVRSPDDGPPGRLRAGEMEVGGAVTIPFVTGGPYIGIAVLDELSVEVGGEMASPASRDEGDVGWGLGWIGLRGTPVNEDFGSVRLAFDVEGGGGLGVGGSQCENSAHGTSEWDPECPEGEQWDGRNWADRLAYGGYVGIGLGLHIDWFSVYLRHRWQFTEAENIPFTVWWNLALGVDFLIGDTVSLYAAYVVAGYFNSVDHFPIWPAMGEAGLAVKFDMFGDASTTTDHAGG